MLQRARLQAFNPEVRTVNSSLSRQWCSLATVVLGERSRVSRYLLLAVWYRGSFLCFQIRFGTFGGREPAASGIASQGQLYIYYDICSAS